jgi:hypothetical protein
VGARALASGSEPSLPSGRHLIRVYPSLPQRKVSLPMSFERFDLETVFTRG